MKQYVECDNCGSKIYFGDSFYEFNGRCGVYCCAECFVVACGACKELVMDSEQAEDHCSVF